MIRSTKVNAIISDLIHRLDKDPIIATQITSRFTWKNTNQLTVFQFNHQSEPDPSSSQLEIRSSIQDSTQLPVQQYQQHLRLCQPDAHEFSPADLDYVHPNQLYLPTSLNLSHSDVEVILRQGAILSYYQQQITILSRNFLELLSQMDTLLTLPTLFISQNTFIHIPDSISFSPPSTNQLFQSNQYHTQRNLTTTSSSSSMIQSSTSSSKLSPSSTSTYSSLSSSGELSIILAPLSQRHEIVSTFITCKTHIYYSFEQWGICRDKFIVNALFYPQKRGELYALLTADYHRLNEWILKLKELTHFCSKSTISKSTIYQFLYNQFSLAIPLVLPPNLGLPKELLTHLGIIDQSTALVSTSTSSTISRDLTESIYNSTDTTSSNDLTCSHLNGYLSFTLPTNPNASISPPSNNNTSTSGTLPSRSQQQQQQISFIDSSMIYSPVVPSTSLNTTNLNQIPSMLWTNTQYQLLANCKSLSPHHQTPSTTKSTEHVYQPQPMQIQTPQPNVFNKDHSYLNGLSNTQSTSGLDYQQHHHAPNAPQQHQKMTTQQQLQQYNYSMTAQTPQQSSLLAPSILSQIPLSNAVPQIFTTPKQSTPFLDFIHNSHYLGTSLSYHIHIKSSEGTKQYGMLGLELQLLYMNGKYQITIKNTGSFMIRIIEALFTILDSNTIDQIDQQQPQYPEESSMSDQTPKQPIENIINDQLPSNLPTIQSIAKSQRQFSSSGSNTFMSDGIDYDVLVDSHGYPVDTDDDGDGSHHHNQNNTPPPNTNNNNKLNNIKQLPASIDHHHLHRKDSIVTPISRHSNRFTPQQSIHSNHNVSCIPDEQIRPTSTTFFDDKHPLLRRDWLDFVNVDKSLTPLPQRQQNLLSSQRVKSIHEVQPSFICFSFESPSITPYVLPSNSTATVEQNLPKNNNSHNTTDDTNLCSNSAVLSPQPLTSPELSQLSQDYNENNGNGNVTTGITPHRYSFHHQGFPKELLIPPNNNHTSTTTIIDHEENQSILKKNVMNGDTDEKDDDGEKPTFLQHHQQYHQKQQHKSNQTTTNQNAPSSQPKFHSQSPKSHSTQNSDLCCSFLISIGK